MHFELNAVSVTYGITLMLKTLLLFYRKVLYLYKSIVYFESAVLRVQIENVKKFTEK